MRICHFILLSIAHYWPYEKQQTVKSVFLNGEAPSREEKLITGGSRKVAAPREREGFLLEP
jgi:hypothetical protein